MITGTLDFSRSDRHTSLPGRPGSIRSSRTRSAPVRSKVSSASGPVEQTATSNPSLRSRYEMASLNESSSSTTSTRVTSTPPGRYRDRVLCGFRGSRSAGAGMLAPQRYEESEGGPGALDTVHRDLAVVGGHHVLDDGQPEAGAAGRARARRIDPVEAFEDPLQVPLGDADALVGHAQLGVAFAGLLGADDHAGSFWAVGDGVLQQVAQRGDQQVLIAQDGQVAAADRRERDTARVRLHPAAVHGLGDHRV